MATQRQLPASARFGPFEICFDPPELRKSGYRLKLSGQALQVLLLLADEPGRVVTREELQRKLWPNAAYGDFEHGLNAAVNRLRETLGDSAAEPRYIETIPRQGYRFIADFDPQPALPAPPIRGDVTPVSIRSAVRHRSKWLAVAGVLVVAAGSALSLWSPSAPNVLAIVPVTHNGLQKGLPVTDGERLYFAEGLGVHRWGLSQVSTEGGETLPLGSYTNLEPFQISRNQSELLAGVDWDGHHKMEPEITIVPLPGGAPHRLGIFAHWAAWSPDEKSFIYARDRAIYAANGSASSIQKLADISGGIVSFLQFSPDGTRIRFTLNDATKTESSIWEMRPDGTNLHPLFSTSGKQTFDCCGSWTPDGKYYVFQRIQNDGLFQPNLWVTREAGLGFGRQSSTTYPLTMGPLHWSNPILSRDGRTIFAIGSLARGQLVRYDARSADFLPFLSGISASELDFTRDGQWVTYVSTPNRLLWRSRTDGSERLQLTDSSMEASLPRWSPDGKQIAFIARERGKPWKINIVSAQGGAPQQLLAEEVNEIDPTWAPDGSSLAFGRMDITTGPERQAIFVVDLKDKKLSEIPGSQGLFSPRWSPDGRYIAADRADFSRLMLFDFHTNTWTEWISQGANFPVWAADSKSIYFDTAWSATPYYCRSRVGENTVEPLFSLDSISLYWGAWGTWSGLAPDGSGLFVRDASAQEIYALKVQWP